MKILFLSFDEYPHCGGKSTHMCNLISGLNSLGEVCEVFDRKYMNRLLLNIGKLILQPVKLNGLKNYLYFRYKLEHAIYGMSIKKRLKCKDFDIISCQDAISCTYAGRSKVDSPIVLTMHTYFGLEYTLDGTGFSADGSDKFYNDLISDEKESLMYASAIVGVDTNIEKHLNEAMKQYQHLDKCKVYSISNFTNIEVFTPSKNIENNLNKQLQLICVRRFVEKNGVIYAVEAFEHLPESVDIHLTLVGDGPEMSKITEIVKEKELQDKVTFMGAINNAQMPAIYSKADIVLVPSITVNGLQEATSISALEAMACGLVTIASDIGGLKELITDKITGILVEEGNAKQIASAILEMYQNKEQMLTIGKNAREYIVQNHSHKAIAKKYLEIFKSAK